MEVLAFDLGRFYRPAVDHDLRAAWQPMLAELDAIAAAAPAGGGPGGAGRPAVGAPGGRRAAGRDRHATLVLAALSGAGRAPTSIRGSPTCCSPSTPGPAASRSST